MALEEARKARIARCLRELGFEATEDNIEQLSVFVDALDIYDERERTRGGLWKEFSVVDAGHHLKSKAARLFVAATFDRSTLPDEEFPELDSEIKDSALDAINYAAFAERHRQEGRIAVDPEE